jgi:hypothetical protein
MHMTRFVRKPLWTLPLLLASLLMAPPSASAQKGGNGPTFNSFVKDGDNYWVRGVTSNMPTAA